MLRSLRRRVCNDSGDGLVLDHSSQLLSEVEAAGSIAFISSTGQVGSLIAPVVFGYVSDLAANLTLGACLVALVLFAGGCAVLSLKSSRR